MPEFITEQYLRASDLDQKEDTIVTIRSYEEKSLRQDEKTVMKWVLHFEERDESFALNTGNGRTIRDLYGKENT